MQLKGNKEYPGTQIWNFISPNYALTGEVSVQVARVDKGGVLKLAVATTNPAFIIKGTVYVYLSNQTIITCTDKGIFDNTVDSISSYFTFTDTEMQQLKKFNIQSIRFNIEGENKKFSSQTGNFTAINKKSFYHTTYNNESKIHETATEIKLL